MNKCFFAFLFAIGFLQHSIIAMEHQPVDANNTLNAQYKEFERQYNHLKSILADAPTTSGPELDAYIQDSKLKKNVDLLSTNITKALHQAKKVNDISLFYKLKALLNTLQEKFWYIYYSY